jgi:hypothetical protein
MTALPRLSLGILGITFASLGGCAASPNPPPPANQLARLAGNGSNLTAAGGYLYWVERGDGASSYTIQRMPESGGDIATLTTLAAAPGGLASDGTDVFWTDPAHGAVLSVPVTGVASGASPAVIVSNLAGPSQIVVASGALFVAQSSPQAALVRIAPGEAKPIDQAASKAVVLSLVSDGTNAYAALGLLTACAQCAEEQIESIGPGSTTPTILTTAVSNVVFLAVDGRNLLAALPSPQATDAGPDPWEIVRLPATGGDPAVVVPQAEDVRGLAAASGSVYWSSADGFYGASESGGNGVQKSIYTADTMAVDRGHVFAGVGWYGGFSLVDETP